MTEANNYNDNHISMNWKQDLDNIMISVGVQWFATANKPKPTEMQMRDLREKCHDAYHKYLERLYSAATSIKRPRRKRRSLQSCYDKARKYRITLDLSWPDGERLLVDATGAIRAADPNED